MELPSVWTQILSLGLFWTAVHCIGMCGPIMVGLSQFAPPSTLGRIGFVLRYQFGKAIVYATFGVVAGYLHREIESPIFSILSLTVAVWLIGTALWPRTTNANGAPSRFVGWVRKAGLSNPVRLGAVMAFLPCALVFWALGVAATSTTPFHGAVAMLLFTALTTPQLLFAAIVGRAMRRFKSERVARGLQFVSGVWIVLASLATVGWIDHASTNFKIFGEPFGVMFF